MSGRRAYVAPGSGADGSAYSMTARARRPGAVPGDRAGVLVISVVRHLAAHVQVAVGHLGEEVPGGKLDAFRGPGGGQVAQSRGQRFGPVEHTPVAAGTALRNQASSVPLLPPTSTVRWPGGGYPARPGLVTALLPARCQPIRKPARLRITLEMSIEADAGQE